MPLEKYLHFLSFHLWHTAAGFHLWCISPSQKQKVNPADLSGGIQLSGGCFFLYPVPPLWLPFFLSVQFFWAEKHSWMKVLQPSLLMSSTETLFSFKTTVLHHATGYTLSILHITPCEQSQNNPFCPKKVNRGQILHEDELLQSRLWWQSCKPSREQVWILLDCFFSPISLLSFQTHLPSGLPEGGCQLMLNTSAYLRAMFACSTHWHTVGTAAAVTYAVLGSAEVH